VPKAGERVVPGVAQTCRHVHRSCGSCAVQGLDRRRGHTGTCRNDSGQSGNRCDEGQQSALDPLARPHDRNV